MTESAATLDCNIAGFIDLHHRAGITRIAPHLRLCPAPTWTPAEENPALRNQAGLAGSDRCWLLIVVDTAVVEK